MLNNFSDKSILSKLEIDSNKCMCESMKPGNTELFSQSIIFNDLDDIFISSKSPINLILLFLINIDLD